MRMANVANGKADSLLQTEKQRRIDCLIETIQTVAPPPYPEGTRKLESLASLPGASEDLSVTEFLVVARPS